MPGRKKPPIHSVERTNSVRAAWSVDIPDNTEQDEISPLAGAPPASPKVTPKTRKRRIFRSWRKKSKQSSLEPPDNNDRELAMLKVDKTTKQEVTSVASIDNDMSDSSPKKIPGPKMVFASQESKDHDRDNVSIHRSHSQLSIKRSSSRRSSGSLSFKAGQKDQSKPDLTNQPSSAKPKFKKALFKLSMLNRFKTKRDKVPEAWSRSNSGSEESVSEEGSESTFSSIESEQDDDVEKDKKESKRKALNKFSKAVLKIKTANLFKKKPLVNSKGKKFFSTSDISKVKRTDANRKSFQSDSDSKSSSSGMSSQDSNRAQSRRNSSNVDSPLLSKLKHDSIDTGLSGGELTPKENWKSKGAFSKILAVVTLKNMARKSSTEKMSGLEDSKSNSVSLSRRSSVRSQSGSLKPKRSIFSRRSFRKNDSVFRSMHDLPASLSPPRSPIRSRRDSLSPCPSPSQSRRNSSEVEKDHKIEANKKSRRNSISPSQSHRNSSEDEKDLKTERGKKKLRLRRFFSRSKKKAIKEISQSEPVLPQTADAEAVVKETHFKESRPIQLNSTLAAALDNIGKEYSPVHSIVCSKRESVNEEEDDYDMSAFRRPSRMYGTSSECSDSSWAQSPLPEYNKERAEAQMNIHQSLSVPNATFKDSDDVLPPDEKSEHDHAPIVLEDKIDSAKSTKISKFLHEISLSGKKQKNESSLLGNFFRKKAVLSRQELELEQIKAEECSDQDSDKSSHLDTVPVRESDTIVVHQTKLGSDSSKGGKARKTILKIFAISAFKKKKKTNEEVLVTGDLPVTVDNGTAEQLEKDEHVEEESHAEAAVEESIKPPVVIKKPSMYAGEADLDDSSSAEEESVLGDQEAGATRESAPDLDEIMKRDADIEITEEVVKDKKKSIFPTLLSIVKWKKKAKSKPDVTESLIGRSEQITLNNSKSLFSSELVLNNMSRLNESLKRESKSYSVPKIELNQDDEQEEVIVVHKVNNTAPAKLCNEGAESSSFCCTKCERLEAELEEARRKHEEMMKEELERKEKEAKIKMDIEVEKVKQKSAMELSMQRHEYNDKLAELEENLTKHRQKSAESDTYRKQAEDLVKKLAQQKLMLEQEVIANRKRLELEAKAAQKVVEESRKSHSKIVEQLEKEKQKIAKDVEQLRLKRQGTGTTPRLTPLPPSKTPSDREKTDLYRIALLVREANKIAQHLKKETTFAREDVVNGHHSQTLVRVTNSKLNVSTFWTMEKFEDRLLQMREMYQTEGDGETTETDDVFYDPNDVWEKAERIGESPGISPKMWKSLRRQHSPTPSPMVMKLSFDDKLSPRGSSRASTDSQGSSVMEKGFLGNISGAGEQLVFEEISGSSGLPPVMSICRDIITDSLDRFKGQMPKESIADRVLHSCETVQSAVTCMLESFNKTAEEQGTGSAIESEVMRVRSVQLAMCIELLLSHCSLWSGMYETFSSSLIKELCESIMGAVKKLANQVVFFLQGCENDIDSMVQESSSQIFESLFQLCRHCGELALATETPMQALRDIVEESLSDEEREAKLRHGDDVKQNFIGGCDQFIDKTVRGSVKTVDECRIKVKSLEGEYRRSSSTVMTDDLLKQIEMTTNTTKVLLKTLQDAQVELDTTIMGDSPEKKCENYFHRNYIRSQQLILHIGNLADSVSLLVQATEPVVLGKEDGSLRRIGRCAEMIQKTARKVAAASKLERNTSQSSLSPDNQADCILEQSVLTDSQTERQDNAADDVEKATTSLVLSVKGLVGTEILTTPNKPKRMLPASPNHQLNTSSIMPWQTAKQAKNMKRNLDLVDIAEVAR